MHANRKRVFQLSWFAALGMTAGTLITSPGKAAEQPVWCEICTNSPCGTEPAQVQQIIADCETICTAGSFIEFQCTTMSCTGKSGNTFPSKVRCLTDVP